MVPTWTREVSFLTLNNQLTPLSPENSQLGPVHIPAMSEPWAQAGTLPRDWMMRCEPHRLVGGEAVGLCLSAHCGVCGMSGAKARAVVGCARLAGVHVWWMAAPHGYFRTLGASVAPCSSLSGPFRALISS